MKVLGAIKRGASGLRNIKNVVHLKNEELEKAFGTLCHLVISQKILDTYDASGFPSGLLEKFPTAALPAILRTAENLADGFLKSPQALLPIKTARSVESEVQFLYSPDLKGQQVYIRGIIDLLLEIDDRMLIYDFKTNAVVKSGEYFNQLNIYRAAVKEWTDKKTECYLVYLRDGDIIEVPEPPLSAVRDMIIEFHEKERPNGG